MIKNCVVLDAMGVIFQSADDVEELLVPFVLGNGGNTKDGTVQIAYHEASLGRIGADEFWQAVGLSPELEDSYLEGHSLNPGVIEFLRLARVRGIAIWCLSNDVGRWSVKLRKKFGLDEYLSGAIISSEVKSRKPSAEIYEVLIQASAIPAGKMIFWDDRPKNIAAAEKLGIESRLFELPAGFSSVSQAMVENVI